MPAHSAPKECHMASDPKKPATLGKRLAVAMAAVGAVFSGECVHEFVPVKVGPRVTLGPRVPRKGYRARGAQARGVAETCSRCGKTQARWVAA
jgi:hypothetical protein